MTGASGSEMEDLPTNWGRWGERDERGTLNLITDEVRGRAVAEARTGRTVSLARPIPTSPMVAGPMTPWARTRPRYCRWRCSLPPPRAPWPNWS